MSLYRAGRDTGPSEDTANLVLPSGRPQEPNIARPTEMRERSPEVFTEASQEKPRPREGTLPKVTQAPVINPNTELPLCQVVRNQCGHRTPVRGGHYPPILQAQKGDRGRQGTRPHVAWLLMVTPCCHKWPPLSCPWAILFAKRHVIAMRLGPEVGGCSLRVTPVPDLTSRHGLHLTVPQPRRSAVL